MRPLGSLVRLQIQRASLKTGAKPNRTYDPAPLLAVARLAVGPDGALGAGPDGAWLVDVHHRAHPATKHEDGQNGISVGFTAHYRAMQDRFGERLTLGCAGENLIAQTEQPLRWADIASGLAIVAPDGVERVRCARSRWHGRAAPSPAGRWAGRRERRAEGICSFWGRSGGFTASRRAGIVEVGRRTVRALRRHRCQSSVVGTVYR
jgi:hypothetical protein